MPCGAFTTSNMPPCATSHSPGSLTFTGGSGSGGISLHLAGLHVANGAHEARLEALAFVGERGDRVGQLQRRHEHLALADADADGVAREPDLELRLLVGALLPLGRGQDAGALAFDVDAGRRAEAELPTRRPPCDRCPSGAPCRRSRCRRTSRARGACRQCRDRRASSRDARGRSPATTTCRGRNACRAAVTTPDSSAAIANSGFTVEPGGYTPRSARSYIGRSGSSVSARYCGRLRPRANRFGSKAGVLTKARMSPFVGSMATAAARWPRNASSATCCTRRSIVRNRSLPAIGSLPIELDRVLADALDACGLAH